MSLFSTFLINLDDCPDRLSAADRQLQAAGLTYQRIAAFDGRGRDLSSIPEYNEARAIWSYGRPLTGGEIGCFLSHRMAAQRFLDGKAKYGLVLEDDIALTPERARALRALIEALDDGMAPGWEVVNLGKRAKAICSQIGLIKGYSLQRAYYFPVTTTALLWTRAGAASFLEQSTVAWAPVDHFLRHMMCRRGTGLSCSPALIGPSGSESVIDAEGGQQVLRKTNASVGQKVIAEFSRQRDNYLHAFKNAYFRRNTT